MQLKKQKEETGAETLVEPVNAYVVFSITEVFALDEVWENIVGESVDNDDVDDNIVVDDDIDDDDVGGNGVDDDDVGDNEVDDSLVVDIPVVVDFVDSVVGIGISP
uniref:Uncharacterized protein n=1 Tax=Panagrolaimus sp. ES5 TaxID=591445 RepID=A0AC34FFV5_9BILA